jgi:membrane-bound metal-dependent hydrolase YbcI (DUF457 family)
MKWYTHMAVGANSVWLLQVTGQVDQYSALLAAIGGLAGLLPDIDAVSAKIHYIGGGILGMFRRERAGVWQHRGIWHSLLAIYVVFIVTLLCFYSLHPFLPLIITLAFASHMIIDSFNTSVGWLFPFYNQKINIIPRFMRTRVGGTIDTILFIIASAALVIFLLGNINIFVPLQQI